MSATPAASIPPRMSVDEFYAWAETQEGKFELENGVVIAMAPPNVRHADTKMAAFLALRDAIRKEGLQCSVYSDGPAVRIDDAASYVPDAVIQCGPAPPGDANELERPVIVVEVLSPSTAYRDLGVKLAGYFQVPSLHHYLIVDPDRRRVIHHARAAEGSISTRLPVAGELRLDPPGLVIAVEALFPAPGSAD